MFDNVNFNVRNIKRIFCLAHVIQLVLRELFEKIKISSTNETFQISWNDKQNRAIMKKKKKKVSYILAKINIDRCLFKKDYSQVIYNFKYKLFSYTLIIIIFERKTSSRFKKNWFRKTKTRISKFLNFFRT
jgi:hypothetical protein